MAGFNRVVHVYTLRVAAHHVEPRFDVPERTYEMYAHSRREAIREAVVKSAEEIGMTVLWKPWLREVARHTSVVSVEDRTVPA